MKINEVIKKVAELRETLKSLDSQIEYYKDTENTKYYNELKEKHNDKLTELKWILNIDVPNIN